MKTVGAILRDERIKKGFTLEQVEKATKIRLKFLQAIENEDYKKMPSLPYVQGFLKNYSTFLGLRPTTILAIFRREYIQKERAIADRIEEPLAPRPWQLTPGKVVGVLVAILVIAFISYFYLQFRQLNASPPLTLESPQENLITQEDQVPVFGNTDIDATITINNEPVLVKEKGKFYKDVLLNIGSNTITVVATNRANKKATIERKVTRTN